MIHTAWQ